MRSLPAQVEALTFMVEVVDVVGAGHRHLLAGGALWPADNPIPLWKAAGIWPKSKDTSHVSKQGDGVPPASPSVRWTRARKTRCHAISPGLQSRGSCRGGQVPRRGTHLITSHLFQGGPRPSIALICGVHGTVWNIMQPALANQGDDLIST